MDDKKAVDIFGIKPIGEAINTTVEKSFEGIEGFLKLVCAPAFEEVGLLFKDHVRNWRLNNILRMLYKAKGKIEFKDDKLQIKAHPRVALSIIENTSLNDDEEIQELWAGLFAASCTQDGQDDENLIFVDLLKQLTKIEARIIRYSCEAGKKVLYNNGLIMGDFVEAKSGDLLKLTDLKDLHRLDRELDHLRSLQLIESGFSPTDETLTANITPTALCLNLYMKTQGKNCDPVDYWNSAIISEKQFNEEEEKRFARQEEERKQREREKIKQEKKD